MEMFPVSPGVHVNIDRARRIVRGRKPNGRLFVLRALKYLSDGLASVNRRHAKRGKLKDEPVIMMRVGGIAVLIDGWHRAARAGMRGKSQRVFLPAHILSAAEAKSCVMPSDRTRLVKGR